MRQSDFPFPVNAEGQQVLGRPGAGCPFCGRTAMAYSANGKAVLHYGALGCCAPRIIQQLIRRLEEDERLQRAIETVRQAMADHDAEIANAQLEGDKTRAAQLRARTPRLKAGIDSQVKALELKRYSTPGDPELAMGTMNEIDELRLRLRSLYPTASGLEHARLQVLERAGPLASPVAKALAEVLERSLPGSGLAR